jgi:hypothetical protein
MDNIVLPAVWTLFTGYLLWYMVAVKRIEPITNDEARMLWKIHKKTSHCGGQKFQPVIRKGGKLKGFQCECGYNYTQRKPMVAGTHKVLDKNPWDSNDWNSMDA